MRFRMIVSERLRSFSVIFRPGGGIRLQDHLEAALEVEAEHRLL